MAEVHVLMATYNGERYLKDQLESILAQTFHDWCLYVSDDDSKDGTLDIIYDYHRRYPDKVKILSRDIRHGSAKENFGYLLENCPNAPYYMFADQDDVWLPEKMEKMLHCIRAQESPDYPVLAYCSLQVVDDRLRFLGTPSEFALLTPSDRKASVLQYNYIPGCTMLFNHALRVLAGNIPMEAVMHDWWLMLCANYMGRIVYCDCCLQKYRQHRDNVTTTKKKKDFFGVLLTACLEGIGKVKRVLDFETEKLLKFLEQNKCFYRRYQEHMSSVSKRSFHIWLSLFGKCGCMRKTILYWRYVRSETKMITFYDWVTLLLRFPQQR